MFVSLCNVLLPENWCALLPNKGNYLSYLYLSFTMVQYVTQLSALWCRKYAHRHTGVKFINAKSAVSTAC